MLNLYRKSPENFAFLWIGIYCVTQSLAGGLSKKIGIPNSANAVLALILSIYLLVWLRRTDLLEAFRLKKPTRPAGAMLFYLPLILISTSNLWLGIRQNLAPAALAFHILLMLCVGFLEEVIFRGFLFEALRKQNPRTAAAVSSLTFGLGHILNLLNGRATEAVLLQIGFAVLLGYLFVTVYLRSGSLIPCILAHQTINILSAFANYEAPSHLGVNLVEIALVLTYLLILRKTAPLSPEET